ncbi:hypothetical protein ZHAS_00017687 [Anopheles sinensis]|uniref:Uncharacterized protein n=1 Tax=Anopheles sinensis TaxID=74873 RepID=A0A084WGZ2_ANOSI|nr:hypothetical protein ZHAS_00017687 [Anopheles sinensis]
MHSAGSVCYFGCSVAVPKGQSVTKNFNASASEQPLLPGRRSGVEGASRWQQNNMALPNEVTCVLQQQPRLSLTLLPGFPSRPYRTIAVPKTENISTLLAES